MNTFLVVYLIIVGLGTILRAVVMSTKYYPRKVEYSMGEDVALLLINVGFFVWALFLYLNN